MEAVIDCPLCCSGNAFDFTKKNLVADCEDCGFEIVKKESLLINNFESIKHCVFCNYDRFYYKKVCFELFKSDTPVCYLCEAEYYNSQLKNVEDSFDPYSYRHAKQSEQALDWKKRISLY